MNRLKVTFLMLLSACMGVVIGGYLFSQCQPRSFLAVNRCENCLSLSDLAGLFATVVVQKIPNLIPFVVLETDKTVVFKHPFAKARIHYIIVPKKDIKNVGEISEADVPYLADAFFVVGQIVREEKLVNYWLESNGPGFQNVTYLHFHLVAK